MSILEYARAYYAKNREKLRVSIAASAAEGRKRNPERSKVACKKFYDAHKEERRAARVKYYHEHLEESRSKAREAYKKDLEASRQRDRLWKQNHRAEIQLRKRLAYVAKGGRLASREAAQVRFLIKELEEMVYQRNFERYGKQVCYLCGQEILDKLNLEHKVPLSRGGGNDLENLDLAHWKCNQMKGKRTPDEFWREEPQK